MLGFAQSTATEEVAISSPSLAFPLIDSSPTVSSSKLAVILLLLAVLGGIEKYGIMLKERMKELGMD